MAAVFSGIEPIPGLFQRGFHRSAIVFHKGDHFPGREAGIGNIHGKYPANWQGLDFEALEKIKCPVIVLGGRQDKVVTGSASEEIAEKLGCKIHMYDGLGHAAYEEARDFNQIVFEFFIG